MSQTITVLTGSDLFAVLEKASTGDTYLLPAVYHVTNQILVKVPGITLEFQGTGTLDATKCASSDVFDIMPGATGFSFKNAKSVIAPSKKLLAIQASSWLVQGNIISDGLLQFVETLAGGDSGTITGNTVGITQSNTIYGCTSNVYVISNTLNGSNGESTVRWVNSTTSSATTPKNFWFVSNILTDKNGTGKQALRISECSGATVTGNTTYGTWRLGEPGKGPIVFGVVASDNVFYDGNGNNPIQVMGGATATLQANTFTQSSWWTPINPTVTQYASPIAIAANQQNMVQVVNNIIQVVKATYKGRVDLVPMVTGTDVSEYKESGSRIVQL